MQLSDWFIFLGSLFFLIGVVSILSDRRSRIKAKGEQTLNGRIEFFKSKNAAEVLIGAEADGPHLKNALTLLLDEEKRAEYSQALKELTGGQPPANQIASILFERINADKAKV